MKRIWKEQAYKLRRKKPVPKTMELHMLSRTGAQESLGALARFSGADAGRTPDDPAHVGPRAHAQEMQDGTATSDLDVVGVRT